MSSVSDSAPSRTSSNLPWYEIARRQYREQRYLRHLMDEEVVQRAKDIFTNSLVLTDDCKIGHRPTGKEKWYWNVLWADVVEEFVLRFGPYPAGFDNTFVRDLQIPRPDHPSAKRAVKIVASNRSRIAPILVKYGKKKYLREAYERGRIRINPASVYDDPSLNPATRDKEMVVSIQPPPNRLRIEVLNPETLQPIRKVEPIGGLIRAESPTDFYVHCLSWIMTPRLFLDFEADACLLIREPNTYLRRMFTAVKKTRKDLGGVGKPVHYFDPVYGRIQDLEPFFSKHFRYAYQREYRIVWFPPDLCHPLEALMLELGSMKDACELILLN